MGSFSGWEGLLCDIDEDGCVDAGCPDGTNCTDVPAPGIGAYCSSDCPLGTELFEGKCEGDSLILAAQMID